jgi:hypothetical protein
MGLELVMAIQQIFREYKLLWDENNRMKGLEEERMKDEGGRMKLSAAGQVQADFDAGSFAGVTFETKFAPQCFGALPHVPDAIPLP